MFIRVSPTKILNYTLKTMVFVGPKNLLCTLVINFTKIRWLINEIPKKDNLISLLGTKLF